MLQILRTSVFFPIGFFMCLFSFLFMVRRSRYSRLTAEDLPPTADEATFFEWRRAKLLSIDIFLRAAWGGPLVFLFLPSERDHYGIHSFPSYGQALIVNILAGAAVYLGGLSGWGFLASEQGGSRCP